ncbi:hypothetical protein IAS59_005493 [Cryptococcus gattii]
MYRALKATNDETTTKGLKPNTRRPIATRQTPPPTHVPHTSNKFRNRFSYLESCYTSTNRAIIPHRSNLKSIWYLVFL